MKKILLPFLSLFVQFCHSQANYSLNTCTNWLKTPSRPSYVKIGQLNVPGNQITVEGTINRTTPYSGGQLYAGDIVSKHIGPTDANYLLRPNNAEITTTNGYFRTPDICEIERNKTYHVAMTYDGVALKFYRNGFLMSQVAASGNLFQNNYQTTIGYYDNQFVNTNFIGYINEVRIWNIVRTQSQIRSFMDASLPNPGTQAGLLAYYTFDNLLNKQGNPSWNGSIVGSATINETNPSCAFLADSCIIRSSISNIINTYTPVLSFNPCENKITVESGSTFNVGDTVLIIQMKGAIIDSSNTGAFGSVTNYQHAGNYEFNYVKSRAGNTIELKNFLTRQYNIPSGKVQLIRVPYYRNADITSMLTCLPWDGNKGGVLVLNVENSVTLNADIDVSERGFKGGQPLLKTQIDCNKSAYYYPPDNNEGAEKGEGVSAVSIARLYGRGPLANGGGGGNAHNAGGAGGGNSGKGGTGGNQYPLAACNPIIPILGGISGNALPYSNSLNKVFLGGGGGSGHTNEFTDKPGGSGGGIVFIIANTVSGNARSIRSNGGNVIECSGQTPGCANDGHSGGGAGGSILSSVIQYTGSINITANGGKGADAWILNGSVPSTGPGGGGGGGLVWYNQPTIPGSTTISIAGGPNGVARQSANSPWGSTPGQVGNSLFNLALSIDSILFRKNIDSVRIKDSLYSCNTFDFKGLAYTNQSSITAWQWTFGDGGTANTQNTSHIYLSAGSFIVKLVVTDVNGCKDSISKPVTASIVNITKSNDTSLCGSSAVQLFAGGGTIYGWTPASSLNNANIFNPVASPTVTTTYYVTVRNAAGCSKTDSIKIAVDSLPVIVKSNDTSICKNSSIQLSASGGSTYSWTPASSLNNPNIFNPVATPSDTTTYYVTVTNGASCSKMDSIKIRVNKLPVIVKSNDTSICKNSSAQLFASGGSSYSWMPASTLNNSNIPNPIATPPDTTVYFVTVTDGAGCSKTDSVKIRVEKLPVVTKSNDTSICIATPVQLFAGGGSSYSWTPASTLNNPNISNPIASPLNTTTYYLTVSSVAGCLKSDSVKITVDSLPVISKSTDTSICKNSSAQLFATGGASYSWSPASSLNNANIPNPIASPSDTTTYYVTVTNGAGCSKSDSIKIAVLSLPVITKSNDTSLCSTIPVQLFAGGGTSYSWTPASTLNNANIANPVASPTATTIYQLTVTNAAGCSKRDSVKITVDSLPVISKSNDTSICNSSSVQLFAGGGLTYSWTPSSTLNNSNIFNPIATPADTTTYYITVTSAAGCSQVDSVKITVNSLPVVSKSGDTSICNATPVQLFAGGGIIYSWSPASTLNNPNIFNPVAIPSDSTTYFVTVTNAAGCSKIDSIKININAPVITKSKDTGICKNSTVQLFAGGGISYSWTPSSTLNNPNIFNPVATPTATTTYYFTVMNGAGCSKSDSIKISSIPLPIINASRSNDITCSQHTAQLMATGGVNYSWSPATDLSKSNIVNPIASPGITTLYQVIGKDVYGCSGSASVTVKVDYNIKSLYLMPNSFTPNRDGVNDCFGIKYWGDVQELDFSIYNRFGERVFYTKDPRVCWDGRYKQALQDVNIFVYVVKAKTACGSIERKGTVTILK